MPSELRNKVVYYKHQGGGEPVKKFIDSLSKLQKAKVFNMFALYQDFGLTSMIPHTKHLTGTPLWEIKIKGKDSIRMIYVSQTKTSILILHGFIKKTQKTPLNELKIALNRLRIWNSIHTQ